MLKIAICDDERNICTSLGKNINEYAKGKKFDYSIESFYSADELLKNIALKNILYDVIFLDIEMKGINGIEFGEILRSDMKDENTKIIYISWENSYAMDLFKVRPFDFLIKPLGVNVICKVLDSVLDFIKRDSELFSYNVQGGAIRIKLKDILFFESASRKIIIHLLKGEKEFYGRLDDVENEIGRRKFMRIHKSYLINYDHVKKVEYERMTMDDGSILSISQKRQTKIKMIQKELMR